MKTRFSLLLLLVAAFGLSACSTNVPANANMTKYSYIPVSKQITVTSTNALEDF